MYAFQVVNKKYRNIPPYISESRYETLEEIEKESDAFALFIKQTLVDTGLAKEDDLEIYIVERVEIIVGKDNG